MQGTIIVIEGTDGSGKKTQAELLTKRLREDGYDVATFSFPQYDEPSSYFVKKYLNGDYGTAEEVGPYTGSLFYALDRFAAAAKIRQAVDAGKVIILDRYVGSNMAFQGTNFLHVEERRGFFIWLDNLEFELLRIPRPNMSFVLRVPLETSLRSIEERNKQSGTTDKIDILEANADHLERALEVYDDMCKLFPKDFTRIDCTYQQSLLPIETIHEILWQRLAPFLPPKTIASRVHVPAVAVATAPEISPKNSYFTPEGLSEETAAQYHTHLDRILGLHDVIVSKLTLHFQATSGTAEAADAAKQAETIAAAVLPLASLVAEYTAGKSSPLQDLIASQQDNTARTVAVKHLPGNHATHTVAQVQLVESLPRNELDALPDILYPYSSLTLRELQAALATWPYDKKAEVYETVAREHHGAIQGTSYTWDIVSSVGTFAKIAMKAPHAVSHQACSPRHGYEVPEILEEASLSDQFEACFDISLGLYSLLQEAGHDTDAQYAVLAGHALRWKLSLQSDTFAQLYHDLQETTIRDELKATVAEVHPLLAEAITDEV